MSDRYGRKISSLVLTNGLGASICPTQLVAVEVDGQRVGQPDGVTLEEDLPLGSVQVGPLQLGCCAVPVGPEQLPITQGPF